MRRVRVKHRDDNFEDLPPEMGGPDYHQVACDLRNTVYGLILLGDPKSLQLAALLLEHLPWICEKRGVRFTASGKSELKRLREKVALAIKACI